MAALKAIYIPDHYNNNMMYLVYSGGLELLFDKQKKLTINIESKKEQFTLADLIVHLRDKHLKAKPELFVSGDNL